MTMSQCRWCEEIVSHKIPAYHVVLCSWTNLTEWIKISALLPNYDFDKFMASICHHYFATAEPAWGSSNYVYHLIKKNDIDRGPQSMINEIPAGPKYLRRFTADCNCQWP